MFADYLSLRFTAATHAIRQLNFMQTFLVLQYTIRLFFI